MHWVNFQYLLNLMCACVYDLLRQQRRYKYDSVWEMIEHVFIFIYVMSGSFSRVWCGRNIQPERTQVLQNAGVWGLGKGFSVLSSRLKL